MARPRSNIFSKYLFLRDTSLLIQERFVSRKGIGETLAYAIIFGRTDISIDPAYDEIISELLDEFPLLGWRTYLLTHMADIISKWENTAVLNSADLHKYYYGMPGVEHDQDLFSIKERDTRGTFLTSALRFVLKQRGWFHRNSITADPEGQDNILDLIKQCRVENKWDSLSFFNNILREIIFMDYLIMKKGINMHEQIELGTHRNWFKPNNYKRFAKEEMCLLTHEKLVKKVNKLSKERYPKIRFYTFD